MRPPPDRDRIAPGEGQESVWDYPRPPRVEEVAERLRIIFAGETVADTLRGLRVLETSHPPVYYIPEADIDTRLLSRADGASFCEFKGIAAYWDIAAGGRTSRAAAWSYPAPSARFAALRDHYAFYPGRVDACWVGDEQVRAQEGDFYGGWITSRVVGPFKGAPGTRGW